LHVAISSGKNKKLADYVSLLSILDITGESDVH